MINEHKTIAAIVTPLGEGGIGKIIVSGPDALSIVNKVFQGKGIADLNQAASHKLYYGHIYDKGERIDEVILNVVRQKDSFTGEDVVEINCHGGIRVVMRICELLQSSGVAGVEWESLLLQSCKNKKMDFVQKEALQELVQAQTKLGVKVLLDQYAGALSSAIKEGLKIIEGIRQSLHAKDNENTPPLFPPSQGGEGKFENEIVHPHPNPPPLMGRESSVIQRTSTSDEKKSDDLLHPPPSLGKESNDQSLNTFPSPGGRGLGGGGDNWNASVSILIDHIESLLKTASFGMALTTPQVLVILGKPNVGKSTLINAILGEERVLVHHEPGTTRDYVSEFISVDGIPFELVDTAGVRETSDMLEVMSIEMTQEQLRRADKIITVFDNSRNFDQEDAGILNAVNSWLTTNSSGDLQQKANAHAVIPVINKCDLPAKLDKQRIEATFQQPVCCISALNKAGFEDLNGRLVEEFDTAYKPMKPVVFNKRQYLLLAKAETLVKQEKDCLAANNVSDKTFQVLDELKDIFVACLEGPSS
ncbi:MAG TPA: tRNA modification GTPase [Candidatus Wunengus sp. YC63]|uniref:tRNA modification GTPase n=1 Tax=unclassified Candidatus Wunengus TaxID=3367695 RepID=UPI0040255BF9